MAEAKKPTNRERLQEITAGIEQGIKELFESDRYMAYLRTMSRFHRYSVNKDVYKRQVLLCFTLFKTGSLAKSIFSAH